MPAAVVLGKALADCGQCDTAEASGNLRELVHGVAPPLPAQPPAAYAELRRMDRTHLGLNLRAAHLAEGVEPLREPRPARRRELAAIERQIVGRVLEARGEGVRRGVFKEQIPHQEGEERAVDAGLDVQALPAAVAAILLEHKLQKRGSRGGGGMRRGGDR